MKTVILTLAAFLTFNVNAQTEKENVSQDTTKFKIGGTEFIVIRNEEGQSDTIRVDDSDFDDEDEKKSKKYKSFGHWSGIEFGVNTMLNAKGGSTFNQKFLEIDPTQSWNFSLNFAEVEIPFKTPHVGLVTGLAFEHSRYGFKNNYILNTSPDSTWGVMDTVQNYQKNQLRTWSFNVPLLLEFNTSKKEHNNVFFNAGVIGGVHFGTKTFRKYEVLGNEQKDKAKGSYNLNPFKVMATARLGYKNFGLFVNYNLMPMFTGNTEVAYPLTFGVRFG
ncbi:MAG: outer membrane beta-barrel protein [Putridiphycobacter sp.]